MHRARQTALACTVLMAGLTAACSPDNGREDDKAGTASGPSASSSPSGDGLPLDEAIGKLETAREDDGGYEREKFKHWIDADDDGCDTRKEVLLAEAVKKPQQGEDCKLTGGSWTSYYDDETVNDDGRLDIDHMVPLAEAWASGASKWDTERREAFANDLDAERSLVAVSLGENRSKSDRDPAEWMPPAADATCTYLTDWVATKLRWQLAADTAEDKALREHAAGCPDATVTYTPAP